MLQTFYLRNNSFSYRPEYSAGVGTTNICGVYGLNTPSLFTQKNK